MKRPSLFAALAAILFLASCSPAAMVVATPTPVDVSAISTSAVETAYAALTLSAPTATAAPTLKPPLAATDTPVLTAMPDYSVIKFDHLYFSGTSELVLVFLLNGARGSFHLTGNQYDYECQTASDNADMLLCRGAYQAPGREVVFNLYEANRTDSLLQLDLVIPSIYPPTPVGMRCEIEPLWVAPLTGPEGCYAVTCYIGFDYYDGTPNTCDQPWRWPVP